MRVEVLQYILISGLVTISIALFFSLCGAACLMLKGGRIGTLIGAQPASLTMALLISAQKTCAIAKALSASGYAGYKRSRWVNISLISGKHTCLRRISADP